MLYRPYGKTNKMISALGFGSTRFNANDLNDEAGIQRCADLVIQASEAGVNYFDIAGNYAKSQCESIYQLAFKQLKQPYFVTSKSSSFQDNTADKVQFRIETSLKNLGVDKIHFFYMWSIMNEEHYRDIIKKGGAYDGAIKAQQSGLIDHIVFSNHAVPDVAVKIIEEGLFEGVTVSYNLLNFKLMEPVLKAAAAKQMGITVMNPLAGGIIPQNEVFFSEVLKHPIEGVVKSAMRFIYSNPQVTSILSGISSQSELMENIDTLSDIGKINTESMLAVEQNMLEMKGLCTGCGYCKDVCPMNIPIPEYMQSYNMSLFGKAQSMYGRSNAELIKRIGVLRKLSLDFHKTPENSENLCIQCGQCEKICTQHLPIIERIQTLTKWIKISCASKEQYRNRLVSLIVNNQYRKIGFYTAGGYTAFVINQLKHYFGDQEFELIVFDSNSARWGDSIDGAMVYSPNRISELKPDCIIISNYIYDQEIYDSLQNYEKEGIIINKLHEPDDVPWVF